MNVLRQPVRIALKRTYATRPFVPPAQLHDVETSYQGGQAFPRGGIRGGGFRRGGNSRRGRNSEREDERMDEDDHRTRQLRSPESPSFYTARPAYYDQVIQIETAIQHARQALKTLQLIPLPAFARASLPPLQPVWKDKDEMSGVFQSKMTTSRYRRVTVLLNQLNDYNRIARTAGCGELADGIAQVVELFERGNKDAVLARGKRKTITLDEHGRTYTYGKRKTSTARVWMIPVQPQISTVTAGSLSSEASPSGAPLATSSHQPESIEKLFGLEASTPIEPALPPTSRKSSSIPVTTVLVNNIPLAEYFPLPADRERIIRPFKVGGVLGAYNVFCLVRGGGTTGQSGAVAHGIAKGLAAHEPKLEAVLRRAKLMRRDPRMVERKKTGLAKSRKRYAWVKR